MLTCPPVPRPNSAVATLVCTANSWTASVSRKLPSAELICVSIMLTPSSRNTLDWERAPATLKPPPCVPVDEGRTPGVSRARSRYWRAFSGMFDMTWLSTTLLSVLLSVSSSGVAAELTSTTWVTLPISRATSKCVIWSTWTTMFCSVTLLKPWDSTTREYTAGPNCKNWKLPLLSLTTSILALVDWLVSVSLAPVTAAPLGSLTVPTMLPVGEAETATAMKRTNNVSAHEPNCSLRYELLDNLETRLRSINTSTPSQMFFGLCTAGLSRTEFAVNVQLGAGICQGPRAFLPSPAFQALSGEFLPPPFSMRL